MASKSLQETQKNLKLAAKHLVTCSQCQCKSASQIAAMNKQLREIWILVKDCRDLASEMLGKDRRTPIQVRPATSKNSRVVIKWK